MTTKDTNPTPSSIRNTKTQTHGYSRTKSRNYKSPEYSAYISAKGRCVNPNNSGYARYGGRGVEFRFTSFEQFFTDIGPKPSPNLTLDRINNDGHYESGNIHWTTPKTQSANRHNTARYLVDGKMITTLEVAALTGMTRQVIYSRKYYCGWCDACTIDVCAKTCPHK